MNYLTNNLNPDEFIEGPTDDELKKIEEELEKYSEWRFQLTKI